MQKSAMSGRFSIQTLGLGCHSIDENNNPFRLGQVLKSYRADDTRTRPAGRQSDFDTAGTDYNIQHYSFRPRLPATRAENRGEKQHRYH
ncbi:predicted protein [Uncinocarpus reesii 1704]|uniref:Uncharacterized protein n=1 Tax=Uncinocarpus reesii (strain UAMH 1704) TaxID=336963 RepID=C4JQE4_UNCRE|nr:uncharacterized protein UREG_04698 [Uncinocarpus reesii 1704]EEP79852.1 predicted protein [Uncinocarpus reesii 1704]